MVTKAVSTNFVEISNRQSTAETLPAPSDSFREVVSKTTTKLSVRSRQTPPLYTSEAQFRQVGSGYFLQLLSVAVPLWVSDALACVISVATGLVLSRYFTSPPNHYLSFVSFCLVAFSFCFWSIGLYPGAGLHPAREMKLQFRAVATGTITLVAALLLLSSWRSPYVIALVLAFFLMLVLLPICRGVTKSILKSRRIALPFYFLGSRTEILHAYRDMNRFGWPLLKPVGRFCEPEENWDEILEDVSPAFEKEFERQVAYCGTPDLLVPAACCNRVYRLFVVDDSAHQYVASSPWILNAFPEVVFVRASRSHFCASSSLVSCGLLSGVKIEESLLLPWPRFVKRVGDILVSGFAMLALSPLLLLIAFLIKLAGPGPVTFNHPRIGRGGQRFSALKFRSMAPNADEVLADYLATSPELQAEWDLDHKLKNDPRVTWIGKFLRRTSLDELPQLWNVFVGDMSLVGPRPIVDAEVAKYGTTFRDYLRVTPGITGLWQISGRNNTTYAERLAYDEFYVRCWSPWMDLYILIRTVRTVLFCEGAY